jgi:hypothetical protein
MWEPLDGLAQMIDRCSPAFGLRADLHHRRLRVHRERLRVDDLAPEFQRFLRIAPRSRLVGRRTQPRRAMAFPLCRLKRRFRPLRQTVAVVDVRGEEQQLAVVRPQLQRFIENLDRLARPVELLVGPEQRPRRPAGLLPEPAEAVAQEQERRRSLAEVACRDEVRLGVVLVPVLDARREPVELQRLVQQAAVPQDPRERVVALGVASHRPECPAQQVHGGVVLASVERQLARVLLPEEGRTVVLRAQAAEQLEALVAPSHLAQVAQLFDQQVRVVGEQLEELLDARELCDAVSVIRRQRPAGVKREAVSRRLRGEDLMRFLRLVAVVPFERLLERVEEVVERRLGELEALQIRLLRLGNEHHPARPGGPVAVEHLWVEKLPVVALVRVAHDVAGAATVVPDRRLQVGARGFHRGQRERDAAVEQRPGGVPGHGKFACRPAVLLRPAPLAVGGRAVVADLLRDREVLRRHVPVATDRRERGRRAGHVVLPHEPDRKEHTAAIDLSCGQPPGESLVEGGVDLERPVTGCGEVSAGVRAVTAPGGEPGAQIVCDQGMKRCDAIAGEPCLCMVSQLDFERGELEHDGAAFEMTRRLAQEREGFGIAVEELEQVARLLDGGAVPGAQLEAPARDGERLLVAVFVFQDPRAGDMGPGLVGGELLGAGEPVFGSVEVPKDRGDLSAEGVEVGAERIGRRREVAARAERVPGVERAAAVEQRVGVRMERLEVSAVVAPRAEVEDAAHPEGAQVAREPTGQHARGGPPPLAERPQRPGGLPRLDVEPPVVQVADATEILDQDFHGGNDCTLRTEKRSITKWIVEAHDVQHQRVGRADADTWACATPGDAL